MGIAFGNSGIQIAHLPDNITSFHGNPVTIRPYLGPDLPAGSVTYGLMSRVLSLSLFIHER